MQARMASKSRLLNGTYRILFGVPLELAARILPLGLSRDGPS
jgi:hypothetical protein